MIAFKFHTNFFQNYKRELILKIKLERRMY